MFPAPLEVDRYLYGKSYVVKPIDDGFRPLSR